MAHRPAVWLIAALAIACATASPPDPGAVARTYAEAGRWPEAAQEIEIAVRAHPRDAALRREAAQMQMRAGHVDRAVEHLELTVSQLAPRDPEAWIQLAELERGRENVTDAYVAYRRASELAPEDIRAVSGLALTADSLGFDDEARVAYARWAQLEQEADERGPEGED